jgi:hypothetical protein
MRLIKAIRKEPIALARTRAGPVDDGSKSKVSDNSDRAVSVGAAGSFNPGPNWEIKGTDDFNGDGRSDILWQNSDGTPAIWPMTSTPTSRRGCAG